MTLNEMKVLQFSACALYSVDGRGQFPQLEKVNLHFIAIFTRRIVYPSCIEIIVRNTSYKLNLHIYGIQ